jgi:hypothetical protein
LAANLSALMSRALAANLSASILIDSVPGFIGLLVRRRIMLAAFEFALSLYRLGSALLQWQSSPGTLLLMEMLLLWLKKADWEFGERVVT